MSASGPSRINLGANTKVSLNDRFTKLAKTKPAASMEPKTSHHQVATRAGSAANKSLALQMGARPSVQAALKLKAANNKKLSLNQRLGGNRFDSSRIGKVPTQQRQGPPQRQGAPVLAQQRKLMNQRAGQAATNVAISRVGPRGGMGLKNRIKFLKTNNLKKAGMQQQGVQKPGFKSGLANKKKPLVKATPKKPVAPKDKESLDMDLDSYMSKTKSALDTDLDSYMAQVP